MASAEPFRWKLPSATRTYRDLQVALPHCGVPPANNGKTWPHCCGFVVLPESQSQRLIILRHGYFDVVPAAIGRKATDQTWQYEQWLHLKCAGHKHRRDVSPTDSVAPEICAFQQEVGNWRCSPWMKWWVLGTPVLHHGAIRPNLGCSTPEEAVALRERCVNVGLPSEGGGCQTF